MDMPKFKDGRVHLRNFGMKGLNYMYKYDQGPAVQS